MQTKKGSAAESLTNISIGLSVGFLSNIIVLPAFGYPVTISDSVLISLVFTVISFIRSYTVRRIYNKYNFFSQRYCELFATKDDYVAALENDNAKFRKSADDWLMKYEDTQ